MDLTKCDFFSPDTKSLVHRFQQSKGDDQRACFMIIQAAKKDAENHIKASQYSHAERCYLFCLEAQATVKRKTNLTVLTPHDEAVLWSNSSYVKCKQEKYEEAFSDAYQCIYLDNGYSKGFWRASRAKRGQNKYGEATYFLLEFLTAVRPENDYVSFMSEVASLIPYIKSLQEWKHCEDVNIITTEAPVIWQKVIKYLYENNEFSALGILTIGTCGDPSVPLTIIHKMAAVPQLSLSFINIGKMIKSLIEKEGKVKSWHLLLAEFFTIRGADMKSIADHFNKPFLLAVTELCLEGDVSSFLSLVWNKLSPAEYDMTDSLGNTALHALVKSHKRSEKHAIVIFHELMKKGCFTFIKDKDGKIPKDYVTTNDRCHEYLVNAEAVCRDGRLNRMKLLHTSGNKAWKENKCHEAVPYYNLALFISELYREHSLSTVLYSNLSAAYASCNDFGKALEAAEKCLKLDAYFLKGYLRKSHALAKLGKFVEAIETYFEGFSKTTDAAYRIPFLEEILKLQDTIAGQNNLQFVRKLKLLLSSCWPELLESITKNKKWDLVASLLLGPPYDESNLIKQGIKGSSDASKAVMSTFLPAFFESAASDSPSKLSSAPNRLSALLLKLFNLGASQAALALPGETYFHSIVKFSVCARDTEVLEWLLKKDVEKFIITARDNEGHTPLHTLCLEHNKYKENSLFLIKIGDLLLEHGVQINATDNSNNSAAHYALDGSELKTYLTFNTFPASNEGAKSKAGPSESWKDLKEEGNTVYASGNYELAKNFYTQAIDCLELEVTQNFLTFLSEENGHNLAILYGNRAECWYKLGNMKKFLADAKKNVDYDGNWYKGHQRVGRAFRERGKLESAMKAFVNTYKTWKPIDGVKNKTTVLTELVDCAYQLKANPSVFQELHISTALWLRVIYDFVKKKEWLKAEFTERMRSQSAERAIPGFLNSYETEYLRDMNLVHFCDMEQLKIHNKWMCRVMQLILQQTEDPKQLRLYPGDTYFHAIVSIAALANAPPLERRYMEDTHIFFFYIMEKFVIPHHFQNATDDKGNTVLHLLATLKGTDSMRQFLAHFLYERGVNVMARNKDNKQAVNLARPNDIVRFILQSFMDKEVAITRAAEKQKEEELRSKKNQRKETTEGEKSLKIETNFETKPKAQPQANNAQKSEDDDKMRKEKSNVTASTKQPCDLCERKLEDALEYQKQEQYEKAYLLLVEVINTKKHYSDRRHKNLKKQSLQRIVALLTYVDTHELPKSLISNISSDGIRDVLNELAHSRKWLQLENFVAQVKDSDRRKALSDFARSISLLSVIDQPSMDGMTDDKIRVIDMLLNHGARLDKSESHTALSYSMQRSDWKLVVKLLKMGANPKGITLDPKDTPNHAALKVALTLDPGNFTILEELRGLHDEKEKTGYGYLSPASRDEDGNTLLHLAAQVKFSSHALKAVEMLCEWHTPADVPNKEGKLPIDYLTSKNDRRAGYIRSAMGSNKRTSVGVPHTAKPKDKLSTTEQPVTLSTKNSFQKIKEEAEELLKDLPDVMVDLCKLDEEDRNIQDDYSEEEDEDVEDNREVDNFNDDESHIEFEDDAVDEETLKNVPSDEDDNEINLDIKSFDNLVWDVECTEDVWNVLRNRKERKAPNEQTSTDDSHKKTKKEKISNFVKKIIVKYIFQLATGNWQPHLQRRVNGTPDTLQLYKIRLPQGASLIWELAIAFSPRLSESAENLLAVPHGVDDEMAMKKGRVYSELIRVWYVVLKSTDVEHCVRKIVRSHQRGKECIIQKKLRGIKGIEVSNTHSSNRFPALFIESDKPAIKDSDKQLEKRYFPPASAHHNEFHILKFYSFSSNLVSSILSNAETKIDFPFRVTDIEHAIISLDSNTPLLLLGRSGTGKTTCCLYRLWGMFLCYWEQAMKYDSPLIPRDVPEFLEQEKKEADKDNNAQASAAACMIDNVELDDEENEEEKNDILYEHLHQIFVTKNPVLCTEVEKNFQKLCHATTILRLHNSAPRKVLPNTLQEVDDVCFPLFLTSRQLLLMLDASIDGEPFFERNEDLALKVAIPGWGTQEDIFNIAPIIHDFVMDSSDEDNDEEVPKKARNLHTHGTRGGVKVDLRRECTYEIFSVEVWPKISRKIQLDCHASLVWTEIMSFIKGSYEALNTESGYLDKNQYLDLGRKRAPNFSGDRAKIYEAFLLFNSYKQHNFLFDEADLVYKLYSRLRKMTYIPWTLHEIYVDETQDFTQAELALLVSLSLDPNKMFLTGDTAQSIMRGISFRFSDLKSLFYYAKESARENEKYLASIKVPQKVHQLRYNYRSHTGILSLASSVLDILIELFPDSFDLLQKDQGMFAGPKPVLIESCSPADLALLLTGNRRKTSHIEFGAHQAILVANEGAKDRVPEELKTGIVLSIYESKGLEFDDVLIYNFFKDSQAYKEWRVVTAFLENLATRVNQEDVSENLVEINTEILSQSNRPRALTFDPNQHKLLNSELKQLYTALTRARVNVWIFDEDEEKRAPMFEYFKALSLVKCLEIRDTENITEELMFADSSSLHEWKQAGDNYMKQRLYQIASKCYRKALCPDKEKLALAYQTALEASRLKFSSKEMREQFQTAGTQFLRCGDLSKAAICFQNAKEFLLAAQAYEKNGQFEEAAVQYRKLQNPEYTLDESRCLEKVGFFGRAVQVLSSAKQFDRAMDCLKRYKILVKKAKELKRPVPQVLVENKPSQTEENLCFSAAKHHHDNKEKSKAIAAIRRIDDFSTQIDFFKNYGYFSEAAELMMEEGRTEEAATLMLRSGEANKALEYARASLNKQQTAFISLVLARKCERETSAPDKIKKYAQSALHSYIELGDHGGIGHAKLMLGKHLLDAKLLKEAMLSFENDKPPNTMGQLESFAAWMNVKVNDTLDLEMCRRCVSIIRQALRVLLNLADSRRSKNEELLSYLKYYGFDLDVSTQKVSWYPKEYPLCQDLLQFDSREKASETQVTADKAEALKVMQHRIMSLIKVWILKTRKELELLLPQHLPCRSFLEGLHCTAQDCRHKHCYILSAADESRLFDIFKLPVLLDFHLQNGLVRLGIDHPLRHELESLTDMAKQWESTKNFLDFLLPASPPLTRVKTDFIAQARQSKEVVQQIERYLKYLWDNPGRVARGKSKNVVKERCKSSDWIVQAGFLSVLLKFDTLKVDKEVQDLENSLMNNLKKWICKSKKYALFSPVTSQIDGKTMVETIGSRFLESLEHLHVELDPLEAVVAFSKFISILGSRNQLTLMPNPDRLIFWMEFYFSLTFFFIAQAQFEYKSKPTFYLSHFLLASVHSVNASLADSQKDKSDKLQVLITQYTYNNCKTIIKRQDHLCNFLVGHNTFSKFSFIALFNELCSREQPQYQLAERVVILAICVLLNIPNGFVNSKYELPIRGELFKLMAKDTMPTSLLTLVNSINQATGYHQVAAALISHLNGRGERKMFKCLWQARESCPMMYQELVDYPTLSMTAASLHMLDERIEQQTAGEGQDQVAADTYDEEELRKLEAKKFAAEVEQSKRTAIQKIIRLLRVSVMKSRLKKKTYLHYNLEEMFLNFKLTNNFCGICGVVLNVEKVETLAEEDSPTVLTKDVHSRDGAHRIADKNFKIFYQIYTTQIHHQLDQIERFLLEKKVEDKPEIYTDIELEVSKVLTSLNNFKNTLSEVMSRRSWSEHTDVMEAFKTLTVDFEEKKDKIVAQFIKVEHMKKEEDNVIEKNESNKELGKYVENEILDVVDDLQSTHQNFRSNRGRGKGRGRQIHGNQEYYNSKRRHDIHHKDSQGQQAGYDQNNRHHTAVYYDRFRRPQPSSRSYYQYPKEFNQQEYNQNPREFNQRDRDNHRNRYYNQDQAHNFQRPGRNENNARSYGHSNNRDTFQNNLPPRFRQNFHRSEN